MTDRKILIVEDEKLIVALLERRLRQFGYTVVGTASTGELAISKALSLSPDLILMDIHLKGDIDGIDAVIEIKKKLDVPVVYLTSYSDEETLERAKNAGSAGFLIKPINEQELNTFLNITFSKYELEKKLRNTIDQFNAFLELSHDFCFLIDDMGQILDINSSALKFLGYEKNELLHSDIYCIFNQEKNGYKDIFQKLINPEKNNKSLLIELKKKNGEYSQIELNSKLLYDKGEFYSIICIGKVTEPNKKNSVEILPEEKEEALVKQNKVLNSLIKSYLPFRSDLMEVLRELTKVTTEALNIEKTGIWLKDSSISDSQMDCLCLYDKAKKSYVTGEIIQSFQYPSYFDSLDDEDVINAVNARLDNNLDENDSFQTVPEINDAAYRTPIYCSGEEIGIFTCEHTNADKIWTTEEENFIILISELISIAFAEHERRNTADLLESSEKKNKAIIDVIPDLMFRISEEGVFLDYKCETEESIFLRPLEFLGKTCSEVLPQYLAEITEENIKRTLETGKMQTFDSYFDRDGERKYLEARMVPCEKDEVLTIIRDLTESKINEISLKQLNDELEQIVQKRTDELLRLNKLLLEKQSHQKALLDSIPDIAWLKDSEHKYIAVNQQFSNALKMEPEGIVGKTDYDLYDKLTAEKFISYDKKVLYSHTSIRYESKFNTDKITKWIETIKVPIYNTVGGIVGTAGTSRDITERKLAEELLEKSNEELEKLVFERTANLQRALDELREEINERKNAENALRESEKRFRMLYEKAPLSYQSLDINGNIVDVNFAWLETLGYTREETIGKWFGSYLASYHKDKFSQDFQTILTKGEIYGAEYDVICRDNSSITIQLYGRSGFNNLGRFKQAYCILFNVTERKRMESKLIESEARYRKLVEFSPDGIFLHSNGKLVFANKAGAKLLGVENYKDIVGRPIIEFIPEDFNELIFGKVNRISAEQQDMNVGEAKVFTINKNEIDVEILSVPSTFKDKPAVHTIVRNISERRQSEKALKLSEERFRTIFENSPVGIIISLNGIIKYANEALLNMFEYSSIEEIAGRSMFNLITPEYRKYVINDMIKRIHGESLVTVNECYGRKKNGSSFPFFVEITYLELPEGRAIVAFFTDISEQKIREEQIKASLREKEILLKEIHHRVKNNLQIISSLLSLQSEYIKDRNTFSLFNESINRIKSMALIHERLYQSKNFSSINFSEYISDISNYLFRSYQASSNNIKLKLDIEPVYVSLDSAIPCGFIINELLSNSLKYAFVGMQSGTIKISFKTDERKQALLVVSDNGIGLPGDIDIQNIDTLGLQLVNNLIEQLEGNIELKRGNGTRFIMKFKIS